MILKVKLLFAKYLNVSDSYKYECNILEYYETIE